MREEENESEEGAVEDNYGSGEINGSGKINSEIGSFDEIGKRKELRCREKRWDKRERESWSEYMRENLVNKQIIKKFGIAVRTVSYLRRYCSMFQIFEIFRTVDEAWIVVFGVSNAKYLTFDRNAIRRLSLQLS